MPTVNFQELLAKHTQKHGPTCTVRTMLDGLDPKTVKDVQAALDTPSISHRALMRVFADMGYKLADQTISRHRRHDCDCPHD